MAKEESKKIEDNDDFDGEFYGGFMFDYVNLIHTILDYYAEANMNAEDGEDWKKGTNLDRKMIPKEVDEAVKKSFLSQLKMFE